MQLPEQPVLQPPEQSVQTFSFLHDCINEGTAMVITAIPNIGNAFFAVSLKNSLLFWISLLWFSIVVFAKVITHFGSLSCL